MYGYEICPYQISQTQLQWFISSHHKAEKDIRITGSRHAVFFYNVQKYFNKSSLYLKIYNHTSF
jgi:hypothetical protein